MKKNYLIILTCLLLNACTEDPAPEIKANFNVSYMPEFSSTIYPSFIFALTEMEKQQPVGYFTITLQPNIQTDIKIIIEESKLNYETIITLNDVKDQKIIYPTIKWKYDDLKNLTQPGNVDITFVCYANENKELARQNLKLGYRSVNECVFAIKSNNKIVPLWWMFAAYVNEDSPVIDRFLQDVLKTTNLNSFDGYQNGENGVFNQVTAIFYTLRAKGVKYSNITNTSNQNSNIYSQYIRFSDEVLNNTQANCADGTAFFCSILEKIGIHSQMVFIPGHVYLRYFVDNEKTKSYLLETTTVGDPNFNIYDATNYQVQSYNSNINKLSNQDYIDGYIIVDIDGARQFVKPIGR